MKDRSQGAAISSMGRSYVTMIYGEYILFLFSLGDNDFAHHKRGHTTARSVLSDLYPFGAGKAG